MNIQGFSANTINRASKIAPQKFSNVEKSEDKLTWGNPKVSEAIDIVAKIKDENGNPRFSSDDMDIFKATFLDGKVEVEPIVRFANKTKIPMKDYVEVTSLKRASKDDKIYDKLDKKFDELKAKNIKVESFKQSIFLPEEEFTLKQKNEKGDITRVSYNTDTMKAVSKKTVELLDVKLLDKSPVKITIENLKDNSVHTNVYEEEIVLKESTIVRKDKAGNVVKTEKMTKSPVAGIMNVEYQYPNGKVEQVSKGSIDKKTGIVTVKKDMKSNDGTRTEFLYEDDPQGNRIIDYKITDKNGKILMKNSQTFEKISENKYVSSNNNDTYEISFDEKELTVKDVRRDLEAKFNFKKQFKGEKQELLNLLKKIPGNELFDTVDSIKKMNGVSKRAILNSFYNPVNKNINIGDDMFVFLHELGHAKDKIAQKTGWYNCIVHPEKAMFTDDKNIQKLWKEERAKFNETATDNERTSIDYFIQAKDHYQGEFGGLSELVAESNALTSSIPTKESSILADRMQIVQQHFPKTIAAVKDAMNYRNDIYAIEYYGT